MEVNEIYNEFSKLSDSNIEGAVHIIIFPPSLFIVHAFYSTTETNYFKSPSRVKKNSLIIWCKLYPCKYGTEGKVFFLLLLLLLF